MNNQVSLERTEVWEFDSEYCNAAYKVKTYVPDSEQPIEGFPFIIVLDGHAYFQIARETVLLQCRNSPKTLVEPSIVISIEFVGEDKDIRLRRFYDFTPPAKEYKYPDRLSGANIGEHGGAENFLNMLEFELIPSIEDKFCVDTSKKSIYGHSLGGLFILYVLFKHDNLFHSYLAISPSIWWNDCEILLYADKWLGAKDDFKKPALFMAVGSEEGFMVENTSRFYEKCKDQLKLDYYLSTGENHASVVPSTISRAFRFMSSS